jgi:hypothetical protein
MPVSGVAGGCSPPMGITARVKGRHWFATELRLPF